MPARTKNKSVKGRQLESGTVQFLYDRYVGEDPERIREYDTAEINAGIARKIYDLRTRAGLSRRELAVCVGTSASAICRLEDSDYEGHSLALLKRIAEALDRRVEVRFLPPRGRASLLRG